MIPTHHSKVRNPLSASMILPGNSAAESFKIWIAFGSPIPPCESAFLLKLSQCSIPFVFFS